MCVRTCFVCVKNVHFLHAWSSVPTAADQDVKSSRVESSRVECLVESARHPHPPKKNVPTQKKCTFCALCFACRCAPLGRRWYTLGMRVMCTRHKVAHLWHACTFQVHHFFEKCGRRTMFCDRGQTKVCEHTTPWVCMCAHVSGRAKLFGAGTEKCTFLTPRATHRCASLAPICHTFDARDTCPRLEVVHICVALTRCFVSLFFSDEKCGRGHAPLF